MDGERRFEDLPAWQAARAFTMAVYRATDAWPASEREREGLASQVRGAAVTVPAKTANGWGGFEPDEPATASHLVAQTAISRRSLREAETLLHVAHGLDLLDDAALEPLLAKAAEVRRRLDRMLDDLPEPEVEIDPFHSPFHDN